MKSLAIIITIILSTFSANNSEKDKKNTDNHSEVTTYYLIRHAEKDRSNASEKDPVLMDKGIHVSQSAGLTYSAY